MTKNLKKMHLWPIFENPLKLEARNQFFQQFLDNIVVQIQTKYRKDDQNWGNNYSFITLCVCWDLASPIEWNEEPNTKGYRGINQSNAF